MYLLLVGTRETLAEKIALDDLPSSQEILLADHSFARLNSLIIDERDRSLIARIKGLHDSDSTRAQKVGVVYGAMHMRNVMNFLLSSLNYRVS